jgi:hypothetical protein
VRGAIFIAAPPGASWQLDLQTLGARLSDQLPDVHVSASLQAGPSGEDYIDFQAIVDGQLRTGSYFDRATLILRDGPPDLWADTIVRFLRQLPGDATAVAMVESNPEQIAPVPRTANAAAVQALVDQLTDAG